MHAQSRLFFVLVATLFLLALSSISAADVEQIDHDAKLERLELLLDNSVDRAQREALLPDLGGWRCGTPLVFEALDAWDELDDAQRGRVSRALWPGVALQPRQPVRPAGKARVPRPGHDTPFALQTEHFNIKWGSLDPPSTDKLDNLAEGLETSWDIEVEQQDYPAPVNSDQYLVDVYIGNTGAAGENVPEISFGGAYAAEYYVDGEREEPFMAYIVFHPDMLTNFEYAQVVASHEFFHVLQAAVKYAHPGYYLDPRSRFWTESTACWITEIVFPESNDYIKVLAYYMSHPQNALHDTIDSSHPYAMCIWAKYLEERHGGAAAIRALWVDPHPDGVLPATDEYLLEHSGVDLSAAFVDFLAAVALREFEEGELFAEVALTGEVDALPFEQPADELDSYELPCMLGANFFVLYPDQDQGVLRLEFDGEDQRNDRDIDWRVSALAVDQDGASESFALETDEAGESGSLDLAGFGDEWSEVWLIASPQPHELSELAGFGMQMSFSYAWSARIVEPDDDDDDADSDDDDDDDSGCGV